MFTSTHNRPYRLCPRKIRTKQQQQQRTIYGTSSGSSGKKQMTQSTNNLRNIAAEITSSQAAVQPSPGRRSQSADPGPSNRIVDDSSRLPPASEVRLRFRQKCSTEIQFAINREKLAAYGANLRQDDVVIAIDDKNIRRSKFESVTKQIIEAAKKRQIKLLVIDQAGYNFYKKKGQKFSKPFKFIKKEDIDVYPDDNQSSQQPSTVTRPSQQEPRAVSQDDRNRQSQQPATLQLTPDRSRSTPNINRDGQQQLNTSSTSTNNELNQTGTELDDLDLLKLQIRRKEGEKLGISLADAKSAKKIRGSSRDGDDELPLITAVDSGTPADRAGVRKGDILVEINGKSVIGKSTAQIGQMIGKGDVEFTVKRDKNLSLSRDTSLSATTEQHQRAPTPGSSTPTNVEQQTPHQSSPGRVSRRDSAKPQRNTPPSTPQVIASEINMNSSKIQMPPSAPSLPGRDRQRNSSEPPKKDNLSQIIQPADSTDGHATTSSPLSRRSASSYHLPNDAPIPRLCRVKAYEEQLGFIVIGAKQYPGTYKISDIVPKSPADNSGLKNQDIIIEVSGVNVLNMKYQEVIGLIKEKKQEDELQLLVVDKPTLEWYKARKIPISSQIVPKMQYIETLLKSELDEEYRKQHAHSSSAIASRSDDETMSQPRQSSSPSQSPYIGHREVPTRESGRYEAPNESKSFAAIY
ncbi:unnamed protein product [Sphagnum balticum]